jgi:hypothetical protein
VNTSIVSPTKLDLAPIDAEESQKVGEELQGVDF